MNTTPSQTPINVQKSDSNWLLKGGLLLAMAILALLIGFFGVFTVLFIAYVVPTGGIM